MGLEPVASSIDTCQVILQDVDVLLHIGDGNVRKEVVNPHSEIVIKQLLRVYSDICRRRGL